MDKQKIYLDYNATTPLASAVIEEITKSLKEQWGNPSSSYEAGKLAKRAIEDARCKVAKMIGAQSCEIIFTSGGTEANNCVIHTAIEHFRKASKNKLGLTENGAISNLPHIVTTTVEHDSVQLPLEYLKQRNEIEVTFVPVSKVTGHVEVADVVGALRPNTCLVTIMLANNETGVLQPIQEIIYSVKVWAKQNSTHLRSSILLHTDAAQAIGKVPVEVTNLGVDYLTIVGHKFYGPRIGALYVRSIGQECPLYPMMFGGGQERGIRPGTENTPMIVGLGMAASLVSQNLNCYSTHMMEMRKYLESRLKDTFGDQVKFNSHFECSENLPNTLNVSFLGDDLQGSKILSGCHQLMASVGAACHTDGGPSKILLACGIPKDIAARALRLSVGRETSKSDIDLAVTDLSQAIDLLSHKNHCN